jgi:O-antigen/teichoic acid export membrane protein
MKNPKVQMENQSKEVFSIISRIKKRDFGGDTGVAIKNSIYQFASTFVSKICSLIFTVILARFLLGPELFGLYSLALTTILFFAVFADLGINQTLVKFVSSSLSKNNEKKAKSYFIYLVRIKLILTLIAALVLLITAKFIANNYYQKPEIYLALLAGASYLILAVFLGVFNGLFESLNNFKKGFYSNIILESSRLILVPAIILLAINKVSTELLLGIIFIALAFSFVLAFLYIYISAKKQISLLRQDREELSQREKRKLNSFILTLSTIAISGVLFGYIDTLMLGRFVKAEFIGYYRAVFSLITATSPLLTFSGALFPLFSRIKGNRLEKILKKSTRLTIFITIPFFLLMFFLSPVIVKIIFGNEYLPSINILRLFSILLVVLPLISIYSSVLVSQNKHKKVAGVMLTATLLNIILNYILITSLLPYGFLAAVYGATIATIISKFVYLIMLVVKK